MDTCYTEGNWSVGYFTARGIHTHRHTLHHVTQKPTTWFKTVQCLQEIVVNCWLSTSQWHHIQYIQIYMACSLGGIRECEYITQYYVYYLLTMWKLFTNKEPCKHTKCFKKTKTGVCVYKRTQTCLQIYVGCLIGFTHSLTCHYILAYLQL